MRIFIRWPMFCVGMACVLAGCHDHIDERPQPTFITHDAIPETKPGDVVEQDVPAEIFVDVVVDDTDAPRVDAVIEGASGNG